MWRLVGLATKEFVSVAVQPIVLPMENEVMMGKFRWMIAKQGDVEAQKLGSGGRVGGGTLVGLWVELVMGAGRVAVGG